MNKEVLEKVSKCKTVEEVLELAKNNGETITKEQAKKAFDMTHGSGELSDEEVSNVSGGECVSRNAYEDVAFDSEKEVQFIFNIGQRVEYYYEEEANNTKNSTIIARGTEMDKTTLKWYDVYDLQFENSKLFHSVYTGRKKRRSCFEK